MPRSCVPAAPDAHLDFSSSKSQEHQIHARTPTHRRRCHSHAEDPNPLHLSSGPSNPATSHGRRPQIRPLPHLARCHCFSLPYSYCSQHRPSSRCPAVEFARVVGRGLGDSLHPGAGKRPAPALCVDVGGTPLSVWRYPCRGWVSSRGRREALPASLACLQREGRRRGAAPLERECEAKVLVTGEQIRGREEDWRRWALRKGAYSLLPAELPGGRFAAGRCQRRRASTARGSFTVPLGLHGRAVAGWPVRSLWRGRSRWQRALQRRATAGDGDGMPGGGETGDACAAAGDEDGTAGGGPGRRAGLAGGREVDLRGLLLAATSDEEACCLDLHLRFGSLDKGRQQN
ncbi:unnamed protein product [Urochloa humidicola]